MNQLSITNDYITSLELSQFSNKEHRNLLESIRNMEQTWVSLGQPNFKQSFYINSQNKKQPMYELSKTESLYIASKFSDQVRGKIILRWEELENENQAPQLPTTYLEALTKLVETETEKQNLQIELDEHKAWYSIKRICLLGHFKSSEAKNLWRPLKKYSIANNYQIKGIFDANYGEVKTYHKDVWKAVYNVNL
jgi:Rha family phage regulatory protein